MAILARVFRSAMPLLTAGAIIVTAQNPQKEAFWAEPNGANAQPLTKADVNTCPCKPPIPSQATATGSCSVAQDNGTFCSIMFNLSQRTAAATAAGAFKKQAMEVKLPIGLQDIEPLLSRMEATRWLGASVAETAAAVQAVATVAAFESRASGPVQALFRDVIELFSELVNAAGNPRKAPVMRILQQFASPGNNEVLRDNATAASGNVFELGSSGGCIAVEKGDFRFVIRARGEAPTCDRSR